MAKFRTDGTWAGAQAASMLFDDRASLLLASRQEAFDALRACGGKALSLLAVGLRVSFHSSGRFDVDPEGEKALVFEGLDESGCLADAVAIGLQSGKVGTYNQAIWALGVGDLDPEEGRPVRVVRSAWNWLRAPEPCVFILDEDGFRDWWLDARAPFEAEDDDHARELYCLLNIAPEIFVPDLSKVAA